MRVPRDTDQRRATASDCRRVGRRVVKSRKCPQTIPNSLLVNMKTPCKHENSEGIVYTNDPEKNEYVIISLSETYVQNGKACRDIYLSLNDEFRHQRNYLLLAFMPST